MNGSHKAVLFIMFFSCQFPLSGMLKKYVSNLPQVCTQKTFVEAHQSKDKNVSLKSVFRQLLIIHQESDVLLHKKRQSKIDIRRLHILEEEYATLLAHECPCFEYDLATKPMSRDVKFPSFNAEKVAKVLSCCELRLNTRCSRHAKE